MLGGGEGRKYSISKRTHGGKWKCFFPSFSFIVHKSRRDETRERWRNRFSHSISHKIQLWARLISSRLTLIDITFSTSIFLLLSWYFSSFVDVALSNVRCCSSNEPTSTTNYHHRRCCCFCRRRFIHPLARSEIIRNRFFSWNREI